MVDRKLAQLSGGTGRDGKEGGSEGNGVAKKGEKLKDVRDLGESREQ